MNSIINIIITIGPRNLNKNIIAANIINSLKTSKLHLNATSITAIIKNQIISIPKNIISPSLPRH